MSDIIITKESLDFVQEVLKRARVFHLENEVVFWALQNLKLDPTITVEEAMIRGMDEWDVCFVKRTLYRVILEITEDWEREMVGKMFDHTRMEVLESGKVVSYLNDQEYNLQMSRPDSLWMCPVTKLAGWWDDGWFESQMERFEEKEEERKIEDDRDDFAR